ncbi:hypothetical protein BDQ17DRAFT_1332434 [Cyathus striatus]|nr:hypothetical protein BDQ17DRAFT_1332434 [Cyathus striatus]
MKTIIDVEKKWIQEHAIPKSLRGFRYTPEVVRNPTAHIALLESIEKLIPYITLKHILRLTTPILSHPTFSPADIMISQDGLDGKSKQMVSLIDWKHSLVLPLYLQAEPVPLFMGQRHFYGVKDDVPVQDPNDNSMVEVAKYYIECLADQKDLFMSIFSMSHLVMKALQSLVNGSFGIWGDSFMHVRKKKVELEHIWPQYWDKTSFPFPLSSEEHSQYKMEFEEWSKAQERHRKLCNLIGVTNEGWVSEDNFIEVYFIHRYLKTNWILSGKHEANWPFEGPGLLGGIPCDSWNTCLFNCLQKLHIVKIDYHNNHAWPVPGWWSTIDLDHK